ncbi:MAG: HDOD domain-containing protein [Desulfobacteraceae bacterium]|nr:HDOD domain-containing protein [Desulfobacteraceae bacterium]
MNNNSEHIPAGNFKASKAEPVIYQAFLGTCVGVALYDRKNKIGGLIHIILPKPPSESSNNAPEKYASSGLPLLINKLRSLGASRESLEATIAGGALVGPISNLDINLDLGGRSADIAQAILKANKIKINQSETGGFFMSTLNLNMRNGDTSIEPTWQQNGDIITAGEEYSPPTIDEIKKTIEELQPIPQTALKILRMVQSSRSHTDDIVAELATDQVLSGQTLKMCNSVMFSGTHKIDTLKDAVLLLGESFLLKSLITAAVDTYYNQSSTSSYSLCKGGLFFHAVSTALAAEKIAQYTNKADPSLASTAGLLHDIGKVVLDQHLSDSYPLFFRDLKTKSALETEKKVIGLTHCDSGKYLAEKWSFSDALSDVVQFHHSPEKAKTNKEIVSIVFLADLLMSRFNTGLKLEKIKEDQLTLVLDTLGLSFSDLPQLVDSMPINLFNKNLLMETA